MSDLQAQIDKIVEAAKSQIAALTSKHAAEAFSAPRGTSPATNNRPGGRKAAATTSARAKGEKRSPESIAKLTKDLGVCIAENRGLRIEEISKLMKTPTKELALPVKKLIADGTIKTTGEKRATKYFPSVKAPAKKATRAKKSKKATSRKKAAKAKKSPKAAAVTKDEKDAK